MSCHGWISILLQRRRGETNHESGWGLKTAEIPYKEEIKKALENTREKAQPIAKEKLVALKWGWTKKGDEWPLT